MMKPTLTKEILDFPLRGIVKEIQRWQITDRLLAGWTQRQTDTQMNSGRAEEREKKKKESG